MAINEGEGDIYSEMFDTEAADQESSLKQSMFVASKNTPEAAAQAQTVAEGTGLAPDIVGRNKEVVQQEKSQAIDYGYLIDNNPGLSKWLESPDNASVGHDDLDNLSEHENQIKEYGIGQTLWHSLNSGLAQADAALFRIPALVYDVAALPQNMIGKMLNYKPMQVRSPEWLRNNPIAKYYDAQQEAWAVPELNKSIISQASKGNYAGAGKTLAAQLVANAPNQVVILASAMMGAPMVGLGYAGATQASSANKVAQESGVDPFSATTDAVAQGSLEMLMERVGTLGVLKKWENAVAKEIGKEGSKNVMKEVGKTIAYSTFAEGNEEFLTQVGQDFSDYVTGVNPDALKGIFQRAVDAGLVGAASGGAMTAPTAIVAGTVRGRQIKQAEQAKQFYLSLGNTAEASKLRERMPEAHRKYVESLVKDSPVENIYIPVEAWDMYMQSKGVDPVASAGEVGVTAEYDKAKQTGTDIKIPLATWANKVVGTEYYQGLADDMKFDPAGQSVNEVKAEGERIKSELEAANAAVQKEANKEIMTPDAKKIVDDETAQVTAMVAEQLKATGKFSDKDIKALSSLWGNFSRVFGGRQGQMPLEFFNKNPLNVKRADNLEQPTPEGQTELNQLPPEANQFVQDSGLVSPIDNSSDVGFINGDNFIQLGQYKTHDQLVSGMGMTNSREAVAKGLVRVHNQHGGGNYEVAAGNEAGYDAINQALLAKGEGGFKGNIYIDVLGQSGKSKSVDFKMSEFIEKGGDVRAFLPNSGENLYFQSAQQSTPEFKQWFEGSKVVDETGKPLVVYHGTDKAFQKFDTKISELGSHFSVDPEIANVVTGITNADAEFAVPEDYDLKGQQVYPAYLSLKNPLDLPSDLGDWGDLSSLKEYLGKSGYEIFTDKELSKMNDWKDVQKALIKKGYDGIEYENRFEGARVGDNTSKSYIVFKPEDIKSAIANKGTFDKNNPNMLMQGTDPLGAIIFGKEGGFDMKLLKDMNYSTFLHETGHAFLEMMRRAAVVENAPSDIKDMSANVLKWLNVESWDKVERKHHEQFAQGFEKYLFEGKAPSQGLRQAFARFRVWLVSVYKSLQNLNVQLSDDIRGVMDRMLATDAEIEDAQSEQGPLQMIQDPISILGEEKGQRYLDALNETKGEAQAALQLKLMEEYQRARKSWWMDELKIIHGQVAQEVNARPEQIALSILQRGKMPDGTDVPSTMKDLKISREDLIRYYASKFDIEVAATDMNALEKEFNVDQLEGSLRDIEAFRDQVGKIRKYDDDYLKEELAKMPRRYVTSNKFAKTLDEAASDLGFESDMTLLERMIDSEAAYKTISEELIQARKELRSVKKQIRQDKHKAIRDALAALPRRISGDEGISVNVVAQLFGYSTAEQFLDVMSRTRNRNELIKEISLDRMKEAHGELLGNKEEMHEQAMQAIHNDKKELLLRMELDYLASQHTPVLKDLIRTVAARIPTSQVVKKYAADIIGRAKVSELSPYQYQLAERRQAKAAGQLLTQGKFDEAFEAKKKELLNYELYRAATAARENVKKSLDNFKNISKSDDKLAKTRDLDYVNAARSILAMYGIGESLDDPYSFIKNTQAYDPDTYETLSALIDAATENVGNYTSISYDQFVNMKEAVDAIWEISKRSRQIEIEGKKMELDEVREHLIKRIQELTKDKKSGYSKSATENDKFQRAIMGAIAQGKRVEFWAELMDGDNKGWFTRAIWNPVIEGTQRFRVENKNYTKKFLDLIAPIEGSLKGKEIVSDELRHIFHSKAELLGALLHTGNQSNLSKLLRGRGWGMYSEDGVLDTSKWDAFITRMQEEGILTKADYDFVQNVWDLFDELKPAAQKAHKEMYGHYFNSITADEFTTPWGKYRGGYAPAIVDPFVSEDAAIRQEKADAEQINNSYMFPTTGRGFTKGRVERYAAPLAMDLRLVPQHLNKVLRFTHIEPRVKDVGRIIRNQEFREYLRDLDPVVGQHMLSPWLQRAAQQMIETPDKSWAGWKVWRELRTRSGINIMAGNVVNTLQQFTGLSIAAVKVQPKYLRNAAWQYMTHPKKTAETVHEQSEFMRTRSTTHIIEIQKTIDDLILNQNKYEKALDFAKGHAYFMQQGTQNVVDMIVWPAAYDQSVAQGNNHDQAVRDADAAVRQTQGDFSAENVSNLESGNAFARAFLMFYSYFNMQANLLGTEFAKVSRDLGLKRGAGRAFYIYLMGFMIPAVVSQVILKALSGEDWDKDDDGYLDDILAMFFGSQFQTATAMFPFVGQVANAAVNKFNKKWYDDDIRQSPAISMIESASHSPFSVYKAIADDGNKKTAIRDTLSLIGILTGLPVSPLSRPLGYLSDVSEGNVYPENNLDFTRGLITGKTGK